MKHLQLWLRHTKHGEHVAVKTAIALEFWSKQSDGTDRTGDRPLLVRMCGYTDSMRGDLGLTETKNGYRCATREAKRRKTQ